ncbi:MAG: hypothetical protein P8Y71_27060 [Pseudolabrys sp.]
MLHDPVRFSQLAGDVRGIFVAGEPACRGQYIKELQLIELDDGYVQDLQTTAEEVASTIVHEAQHARLCRLGFGYETGIRNRIERLCFLSQRIFGLRLPCGETVLDTADSWLNSDIGQHFSDDALTEAHVEANFERLEELGCPKWIQRILRKYVKHKCG